ncbi:MAG TPA: tRNA-intron lyase [Candidatus Nanoarchaeia archaeon]|nr:tRNA-intron lyase [Candidatus Nanoarchaeia archaeon]
MGIIFLWYSPMAKKKTEDKPEEKKEVKERISGQFIGGRVVAESSDASRELNSTSQIGALMEDGRLQLSLLEAAYLLEKKKVCLVDGRGMEIAFDGFVKKAQRSEPNFWVRYCVFKDIRNRGYVVKTALKFGADFRVYDRGVKPGEDHAKWIVYPVYEAEKYTWYDFAAKNRVAHSTKKRLLIALVDEENDCTYYEISWKRP